VKVPRFRIAWVMTAVAIAALDFGAIGAMFGSPTGNLLLLGALPMANVLALGILIGQQRPRSRPFLLGFEAFGAVALAAYIAGAAMLTKVLIFHYLHLATGPYIRTFVKHDTTFHDIILCSIGVVRFGLPQLAFALVGGLLFNAIGNHRAARPNRC
jgi:hypothetical protein